jgi:hypothetical protein
MISVSTVFPSVRSVITTVELDVAITQSSYERLASNTEFRCSLSSEATRSDADALSAWNLGLFDASKIRMDPPSNPAAKNG